MPFTPEKEFNLIMIIINLCFQGAYSDTADERSYLQKHSQIPYNSTPPNNLGRRELETYFIRMVWGRKKMLKFIH